MYSRDSLNEQQDPTMKKRSSSLWVLLFLSLLAGLAADDGTAPEKSVFGDLGSIMQLAAQTAVREALRGQEKTNEELKQTNQGLQVELRDLRAEMREKDATVQGLTEKIRPKTSRSRT